MMMLIITVFLIFGNSWCHNVSACLNCGWLHHTLIFVIMVMMPDKLVHNHSVDYEYELVTNKHHAERQRKRILHFFLFGPLSVLFNCLWHHVDQCDSEKHAR